MKITKTAIAVAISSAFLFGCDFDVGSENNVTTPPGGGDGGGGLPPVENAQNYVQIQDSSIADTGILRIKTSESKSDTVVDSIPVGYLTVDLTYQDNTAINGENAAANAYIQIHTTAGSSNAHLRGEIALGEGKVKYRDNTSSLVETGGTYTAGEELKVKVSWTEDEFSFSIGDDNYGPYAATSTAPVELISLKVGDSKTKADLELIADNLKIYSSDASGDELIFEDDFDNYGVGDSLSDSRYNRAIDVMVLGTGEDNGGGDNGGDGAVDTPSGKYVALHDHDAQVNDAAEIRYSLGTSQRIHEQGKASVYIRNDSDQSAVFTVFGVDSQLSDVGQIISVRLREDGRVYHRPETTDTWTETGTTIDTDQWNKLTVDWNTNSGDNYNLYLNGNLVGEYERRITQTNVSTRYVAVQVGTGNSDTVSNGGTVDVDNLALYSDTVGTAELHKDDFEGFAIGTDLGADPSTTDYDKSGYNAIVQE
ncbi:hypothetical protein [Vibrio breoganii]|uniref:hypothetical protein n=1 Tax=Vibrio breoganii TaxID=553239 RepID=UPI0002E5D876|nr:hypothetical protein [Vibrio breoganii]MDN3715064.1 hypothetical protein [Vibrio breoganii]OED92912.1 hypothetical protein A1QE_05365 [Vibrio breoganii ZF-55]